MQSIFFVILFYSYSSFLPKGVDSIHIEIFDECAFSADEKIAWALFPIPNTVFAGETIENWIPLNGKQGDSKEGTICLFLSFSVSLYLIFISSPLFKYNLHNGTYFAWNRTFLRAAQLFTTIFPSQPTRLKVMIIQCMVHLWL